MKEMDRILTPAQLGRIERDKKIVSMYSEAFKADANASVIAVCNHIASELRLSFSTVYNVINRFRNGNDREAADDDDAGRD